MNPEIGIFASLDLFEGLVEQPMPLNGDSYVEGDPVNLTDPSGGIPTRRDVDNQDAVYSCKCGWIEFDHVAGGISAANQLLEALRQPAPWFNDERAAERVRVIKLSRSQALPGARFGRFVGLDDLTATLWALVPDSILGSQSNTDIQPVALGIFQKFEENFENMQAGGGFSLFNAAVSLVESANGPRPSGFAEEDLPSDLLGFWLAINNNAGATNPEALINQLAEICDIVDEFGDPANSQAIFSQYERAGWQTGWRNWYPRPRPGSVSPGCESQHFGSEQTMRTALNLSNPLPMADEFYIDINLRAAQISTNGNFHFLAGLADSGWLQIDGINEREAINHQLLMRQTDNLYLVPKLTDRTPRFPKKSALNHILAKIGTC